jgi:hypothetical protein
VKLAITSLLQGEIPGSSPAVSTMNKFFITLEGKQKPWKPKKEEFETYQKICLTIWGALPYDVSWAKGTQIYQNELWKNTLIGLEPGEISDRLKNLLESNPKQIVP